jgi:hypothetical protein
MKKSALVAVGLLFGYMLLLYPTSMRGRRCPFPFLFSLRLFFMSTEYDREAQRLELRHLEPYPTKSLDELQSVEKQLSVEKQRSVTLPDDYKVFLSKFGSTASSKKMVLSGMNRSDRYMAIEICYGVNSTKYDIVRENRLQEERIPPGFVAIGEGPNNVICLSLADADYGSIYHVSFDTDELTLLSTSFDGFIRRIHLVDR